MTRRITITILITVWAMMLVTGLTTYFAARSILLRELDERLIARAAALPEVTGLAGTTPNPEDRYLVRTQTGQIVRRMEANPTHSQPRVISAQFARLGDGQAVRSVTVEFDRPAGDGGPLGRTTVVYSGPADSFDRVLGRLTLALTIFGVVGSVVAAVIATAAARRALRPLAGVADVVGEVDERNLSRRIETYLLPDELKNVGQQLNAMLQRLEETFLQRRQFLADASHELRTPVAALVTTLEVTLGSRRPADVARLRRALEDCLSDAKLLRSLVERLTQQVRGEMRQTSPVWQEIDLVAFMQDCVTIAEGLAAAKQVTVEAHLPSQLRVTTDPDRLRRVCLNLLSNAVAYNVPNGRLTLTCRQQGRNVAIEVLDTGVGIPSEHLPHVFSLFYRADPARGSDEGHLGLGLFQVQSDVTALKGICRIDSVHGQGTTISVILQDCVMLQPTESNPPTRWEPATTSF